MERICTKVQELNAPPVELALQRCCLGGSKAGYLLRCNGDRVSDSMLRKFDAGMAAGLESALWEPLPDDSWIQASLAVDAGGLGMRSTQSVALPAFTASHITARPLVAEMAQHTEEAGLCPSALCMRVYDERTQAALAR